MDGWMDGQEEEFGAEVEAIWMIPSGFVASVALLAGWLTRKLNATDAAAASGYIVSSQL